MARFGFTDYQAKYLATRILHKAPRDSFNRLLPIVYDADIDIHPHQLASADMAFNSPLAHNFMLLDESGLGKTVEACISIGYFYYRGERNILVMSPVSEIKHWYKHLAERFNLPTVILDDSNYTDFRRRGKYKPLEQGKVILCTYKFAFEKEREFKKTDWDLVVLDEAHRLNYIYDLTDEMGESLIRSLSTRRKLIITSVPFQSTLLRMFKLGEFMDPYMFGEEKSFFYKYVSLTGLNDYPELKRRLVPVSNRFQRFRRTEFTPKSKRVEMLFDYYAPALERDTVTAMTNYFMRSGKFGLKSDQGSLAALGLYKQLQSIPSIKFGLKKIIKGIEKQLDGKDPYRWLDKAITKDIETIPHTEEEWFNKGELFKYQVPTTKAAKKEMQKEIEEIKIYLDFASQTKEMYRSRAMIRALNRAFTNAHKMGINPKVVIYTESKITMKYLVKYLSERGAENIYYLSRVNRDKVHRKILKDFKKNAKNLNRLSENEEDNIKQAVIEKFIADGDFLITTDLGVEGFNLSQANVVVNFDLPMDPYRTDRRLARVDGYGNDSDLLVVNILNRSNELERWIYDKYRKYFDLFSGMPGRSDLAVGTIGAGSDYEMFVFDQYMRNHSIGMLTRNFRRIEVELKDAKSKEMDRIIKGVLEMSASKERQLISEYKGLIKDHMGQFEDEILKLVRATVSDYAAVSKRGRLKFELHKKPFRMKKEDLGTYYVQQRVKPGERKMYLTRGMGQKLIKKVMAQKLPNARVRFRYKSRKRGQGKHLRGLVKKKGTMILKLITVKSISEEQFLVFVAVTSDGKLLTQQQAHEIMELESRVVKKERVRERLLPEYKALRGALLELLADRNDMFIKREMKKMDKWMGDNVTKAQRDLRIIVTEKRKIHRRLMHTDKAGKKKYFQNALLAVGVLRRKRIRKIKIIQRDSQAVKNRVKRRIQRDMKVTLREKNLFAIYWELV